MATANLYLSIITLNKDRLSFPIESDEMAEWVEARLNDMLPTRDNFSPKDTHRLRAKGWKRYFKQIISKLKQANK